MQTTKMSLANIQGKLSRAEMRQIKGGVEDGGGSNYCSGGCSGSSVGDWEYTNPSGVSQATCSSDIQSYCSSGQGYCQNC